MSKLIKIFLTALIALNVASCATAGANNNQQDQVKNAVLKALEQKYKQPFKVLDFSYKYESHSNPHDCVFLYCKTEKYGTYYFKIQAVDNPIIIMSFNFTDGSATKESIKPLINSFKKNQLQYAYCDGLYDYYVSAVRNKFEVKQPNTDKADKYCNSLGKTEYLTYKEIYKNKHSIS